MSRLERRTPLRRRRRRGLPGDDVQRQAFHRQAVIHGCAMAGESECDGRVTAHHVTPKRYIRRRARDLGLAAAEIALLLWDPHDALGLCERHHHRHERALERVPRRLVPRAAVDFAAGLGLLPLLEATYPDERRTA